MYETYVIMGLYKIEWFFHDSCLVASIINYVKYQYIESFMHLSEPSIEPFIFLMYVSQKFSRDAVDVCND